MKKTLFAFITLVYVSPLMAHAQWVGSSPGPIYYNSGNVGIGTSIPSASLLTLNHPTLAGLTWQINGSNIAGMGVNSTSATWNGGAGIGLNLTVTNADISFRAGASSNTALIVKNSGNIGIGTTNPNTKLEINGNTKLTSTWNCNNKMDIQLSCNILFI